MTEREFATWLREARGATTHEACVKIEERIEKVEKEHDLLRGLYVPHGGEVHHYADESRH